MPLTEPFEFDIPLWRSDRKVALLPELERGIWLECLFAMRLEEPYTGILSGTPEELARLARCSVVNMAQTIHALKKYNVADVHERNGVVTLINRKMNREHKAREINRSRVERHRTRPSCNAPVTPQNFGNTPPKGLREPHRPTDHSLSPQLSEERERGTGGKPKIWTPFRPGTPRELELLRQCQEILGDQWPENSGMWGRRIYGSDRVTADPDKVERVMQDTNAAIKDGEIKTTPAQYAAHRWKEFQTHH